MAHAATIADDAARLSAWARAFEVLCGRPAAIEPLDANDATAGQRLTFPPIFEPSELIGGIGHFRHRPAMADQVRRMGFAWDSGGHVLTVPAPGAFNVRLAECGVPYAGFSLAYVDESAPRASLGRWLMRYMRGLITVLINAPSFYESLPDDPRARADTRWGLMSVAHDLSVHALNYHLVPHRAVVDIADRIRTAVPERYAAWSQPDAAAPLTLTYFYDNDFNRYVYAVWCRCERPEQFASIFLATGNYDQLVAALEVRLAETRAGRGDVASGDFDDIGTLTQTSFEVH